MSLKYNILWIEDEVDWISSIEDELAEAIEEFGYTLHYDQSDGSNLDNIQYKKYDLILMDYTLRNITGEKIIKDIRELQVLTDVVFYTESINNLEDIVHNNKLEGIYYAGRGESEFVEKVTSVIKCTIRKVQDLQNLRGLVMAEVSELDVLMEKIIHKFFVELGSEEKNKLFHKHITRDVEKSLKRKLIPTIECNKKCEHKWKNESIENIIGTLEFESSKKAKSIHCMCTNLDLEFETFTKETFYDDYDRDIIKMRNNLAHCESRMDGDKEVLVTKKGDIVFDETTFTTIRKNIQKYNQLFHNILTKL